MTAQRRLILELIREAGGHLNADELHRLARQRDPHISLSTVYRNLNLLKELGVVVERHLGGEQHHYEINTSPDHHHLVCLKCGEIFEFELPLVEQLKKAVGEASKFDITHVEINMQGYCPNCRKESAAKSQEG